MTQSYHIRKQNLVLILLERKMAFVASLIEETVVVKGAGLHTTVAEWDKLNPTSQAM